ncbi:hypothetical protein ZHAS_00014360 [Anopheles sinensis]|uniref:Uncharacterized protein n=1 Tax=Anopheles sinensis TaxID=74873 RepID=A0A084W825_ANOSI|nr:hypothetical protein ZHAS_00014360 [Anopheles sinensis]
MSLILVSFVNLKARPYVNPEEKKQGHGHPLMQSSAGDDRRKSMRYETDNGKCVLSHQTQAPKPTHTHTCQTAARRETVTGRGNNTKEKESERIRKATGEWNGSV